MKTSVKTRNYMLDTLSLRSEGHGQITCVPLPEDVKVLPLFSDSQGDVKSLQATGSFGSMRFHEMRNRGFSIRQNEFRASENIDLATTIESPSLGFHYTLKNDIHFTINGFPEGLIYKHQYNMVYVPRVDWQYHFKKNQEYACFGIHFTKEYLEEFNQLFPLLPNFLKNVRQKNSTLLTSNHLAATPEMVSIINSILHCDYSGLIKQMYLDIKVPELLLLSLQRIPNAMDADLAYCINLREKDFKKISDAKEYIIQHLEDPGTLQEIAHAVGINEFKLKNGFKQMFGTTVFDFLRKIRMEKARTLLEQDPDKSILDIALVTGYKHPSNFTAAFKKQFGHPPKEIKRK